MDKEIILNYINNGFGYTDISKLLLISRKKINRIAIQNNVIDKLKSNNQTYKSKNYSKICLDKKNQKLIELDKKYGTIITNEINNGSILKDILNIMVGVPYQQVLRFIEYKHLDDKRKDNSKVKIKELSKINGKLSYSILKGVYLKPLTSNIVERFEQLKKEVLYKQRVADALKKEFSFGEKKYNQLCKLYGHPMDNPQIGILNPMYGKSPSNKAGIGIKCWILTDGNKFFARSSLELKIMCYFNDNNIKFQISNHRIQYIDTNKHERTYCPDIVINKSIYEIKPNEMVNLPLNVLKDIALKIYCKKYFLSYGGFITEKTYNLEKYNLQYFSEMIDNGTIIISKKELGRLEKIKL